jgi:hypothetical protein
MEPTSSHCIRCGEHYRITLAVETGSVKPDALCSRSCSEKLHAQLQARAFAFLADKYPELSDYVIKKARVDAFNPSITSLGTGVIEVRNVGGITSLTGVIREYMFEQLVTAHEMRSANVNKTQGSSEQGRAPHLLISYRGRAERRWKDRRVSEFGDRGWTGGVRDGYAGQERRVGERRFGVAAAEQAVNSVADKFPPLANPEE